jgi:hypothetical protein
MSKRLVLHVTFSHAYEMWQVKQELSPQSIYNNPVKQNAVDWAISFAKERQPSQVKIHLKDGTIETEYTYGDDPSRFPG